MENNANIKYEKLKLHIKYLITIAIIICFGSIVLALYNKTAESAERLAGTTKEIEALNKNYKIKKFLICTKKSVTPFPLQMLLIKIC